MKLAIAALLLAVFAARRALGNIRSGWIRTRMLRAPGGRDGRPVTCRSFEPLALEAPWPDAPLTLAPAGTSPHQPFVAQLSLCARRGCRLRWRRLSGLGGVFFSSSRFLARCSCGRFTCWARDSLGASAFASAALVACSPAFLFQLMQPMSDVPAAALWVMAAASDDRGEPSCAADGRTFATSAAILVRPNLLTDGDRAWDSYFLGKRSSRLGDSLMFAAASAPGCLRRRDHPADVLRGRRCDPDTDR